ncbi:MAG: sugar transferase [Clostridia bacterium]|nr:sugar transferase [Clostridia bacterium]
MNILYKFQKTVIFILKITMYVCLFASFFLIFGTEYEWIIHLSRTTGVTFVTFCVVEAALVSVYGGYAVGRLKSKPIVTSLALATYVTDIVTHLQLCIMNVNENNNSHFVYESPHLLVLVMAIQGALIIFFTYFGNYVYFTINPPEKCCVITSSEQSLNNIMPKIRRYKKQYNVVHMIHYTSKNVFDIINDCDTVFLYDIPTTEKALLNEYCYARNKNIYYNFEMYDVVMLGARPAILDDKPLVSAVVRDLTFEQRFVKRAMDIVMSGMGLIVCGPLMLVCAALIKAEDGGSIFFRQLRATKGGELFNVYKFRTMKEENAENRSVTSDDDRITKVGKYLRKFRIDELPQLINIFKGEMSVVGPRPEMVENVDKYTAELPEFSYRLRVKGGLTGYAQIAGKYNTSPKDKLVLDLMYIEKYSLWLDFKLIMQTVTVFFRAGDSTKAFSKQKNKYQFTEK